ncbi:hypothetical protein BGX27_010136 [Mortierella sp. AM989]|nr:hypothetical protein BGX27_010136 [Mortierella sp. AM989]
MNGDELVPFVTDDNFVELSPWRIKYHPEVVLKVVLKESYNSTNSISGDVHGEIPVTSPPEPGPSTCPSQGGEEGNTNLDVPDQTPIASPPESESRTCSTQGSEAGATNPDVANRMNSADLGIEVSQPQVGDFLEQIDDLSDNDFIDHLGLKSSESQSSQNQARDRPVITQQHIEKVLSQTYELHEQPIPRLFVVIPRRKESQEKSDNVFSVDFELYFLCECGEHTMTIESLIPHEVHLAKHEGYKIVKPAEFFQKYSCYILTLMQVYKNGAKAAGIVFPALSADNEKRQHDKRSLKLLKPLEEVIDEVISIVDTARETGTRQRDTLEGADLREIVTYLSVKDTNRTLGNLYRIVTTNGKVKWVCGDHFRGHYDKRALLDLRRVVENSRGSFVEETGKCTIALPNPVEARELYGAMVRAGIIQELDISFLYWDMKMEDIRQFMDAISKTSIRHLKISGSKLPIIHMFDLDNQGRRYDPIVQVTSIGKLECLDISSIHGFTKNVRTPSTMMAHWLRVLRISSSIDARNEASKTFIQGILGNCPYLTELQLSACDLLSLVELIAEELGHHREIEATSLDFDVQKIVMRLDFRNTTNPQSTVSQSEGTGKNGHSRLKVEVICRSRKDHSKDLLSLYSTYHWPVEDLEVRYYDVIKNGTGEFLDKLTGQKRLKHISLSEIDTYALTFGSLQCMVRAIERASTVGRLVVKFSGWDNEIQDKLECLLGSVGERVTELKFQDLRMETNLTRIHQNRFSLPLLESFEITNMASGSVQYITPIITKPQQTDEGSISSGTVPQGDPTTISFESATANTLEVFKPLKEFKIVASKLSKEDWATLVKAIDFTTLEVLSFEGTNFSVDELKKLVSHTLNGSENKPTISLKSLTFGSEECSRIRYHEGSQMLQRLVEKSPEIEINFKDKPSQCLIS